MEARDDRRNILSRRENCSPIGHFSRMDSVDVGFLVSPGKTSLDVGTHKLGGNWVRDFCGSWTHCCNILCTKTTGATAIYHFCD